MTDFTIGQVISARRYDGDKYVRGWYLEQASSSGHVVYIEGSGTQVISDENIQQASDDIALTTEYMVFLRKDGQYNLISCGQNREHVIETFRNFVGYKLIGIIDLAKYNISFPTGEGLCPLSISRGSERTRHQHGLAKSSQKSEGADALPHNF